MLLLAVCLVLLLLALVILLFFLLLLLLSKAAGSANDINKQVDVISIKCRKLQVAWIHNIMHYVYNWLHFIYSTCVSILPQLEHFGVIHPWLLHALWTRCAHPTQ
jgi:hypothetical protein